jgi:hypothetical protein
LLKQAIRANATCNVRQKGTIMSSFLILRRTVITLVAAGYRVRQGDDRIVDEMDNRRTIAAIATVSHPRNVYKRK